jgi:D-arginine dehydrogenase
VVNAAGAWADEVAALAGAAPIGLSPRRRTAVLLDPPDGQDVSGWPMVVDVDEQFYFKPEAGLVLVSPGDETPAAPGDAQADEWDVAVAVDRYMAATGQAVRRVRKRWAGLRSFVDDRSPVIGFDPDLEGFFWCAALGGYGIQTAPAVAELCAALIEGRQVPRELLDAGVQVQDLDPRRLRT